MAFAVCGAKNKIPAKSIMGVRPVMPGFLEISQLLNVSEGVVKYCQEAMGI